MFTEVLAAQERLRFAEESQQLAQRVVNAVAKRVQAGKVPPIEETRAAVALSTTQIELEQAKRDLAVARKQLALLWGNASPHFSKALGNLESSVTLPPFEALAGRRCRQPHGAARHEKYRTAQGAAGGGADTAHTEPHRLSGIVHHAQLGGNTAVAAVILPLPLFDRNQGNIQQAHQRVDKAVDEQAATGLRLRTELTQAYEALSAAQRETGILRDEIIPAAKSAFEVINKGYELGRFGFLEVLDAQRTLFQNQILYVRALANYQRLVDGMERLIAAPIDVASSGVVNPSAINSHNANAALRSGL